MKISYPWEIGGYLPDGPSRHVYGLISILIKYWEGERKNRDSRK
jgi:hypothetical protein